MGIRQKIECLKYIKQKKIEIINMKITHTSNLKTKQMIRLFFSGILEVTFKESSV